AREWCNVRAPTPAQVSLWQAVLDGFLLDHRSWDFWNYIGGATRQAVEHEHVEIWRDALTRRYPAIRRAHEALRKFFWQDLGATGYQTFDQNGYRSYLEGYMQRFLSQVSLVAATEETLKGALVARFQDWLLCQGNKPKAVPTSEKVEHKLTQ